MTDQATDRQVTDGCFMVGRRNPESLLQCNTYLRTFERDGKKDFQWLIDPGSRIDYPHVRKNLLQHVESLADLDLFSLNHQDPDVVGNLTYICEEHPNLAGLVTQDVWRLVQHLDVSVGKLEFANKLDHNLLRLPSRYRIQVVPTPFCHFRGAVAYYDPETRVLFTGDLFGGVNRLGETRLWAEDKDWEGISVFHEIYMPNRSALQFAIRQIRALDPPVDVIAPQHGFLLMGDLMEEVMDRLYDLPVGMDRVADELDNTYLRGYAEVYDELIELARTYFGNDEVDARLRKLSDNHPLVSYTRRSSDEVFLWEKGILAIPQVLDVLTANADRRFAGMLTTLALYGCSSRNLPIPSIGVGVEEGVSNPSSGPEPPPIERA